MPLVSADGLLLFALRYWATSDLGYRRWYQWIMPSGAPLVVETPGSESRRVRLVGGELYEFVLLSVTSLTDHN